MLKNEDEFFIFMYYIRKQDDEQNTYTDWLVQLMDKKLDDLFKEIIYDNVWRDGDMRICPDSNGFTLSTGGQDFQNQLRFVQQGNQKSNAFPLVLKVGGVELASEVEVEKANVIR